MNELGVWDTYSVKAQTLKTAIEVTSSLDTQDLNERT